MELPVRQPHLKKMVRLTVRKYGNPQIKHLIIKTSVRTSLTLSIFFAIFACNRPKERKPIKIQDLKYCAYTWYVREDRNKFYMAHYLEIDSNENYILLRHDTFLDKPKYFRGVINRPIRDLIDATLGDSIYQNIYSFNPPNSAIYDGFDYYLDYLKEKGERDTIQFIPSRSPNKIQILAAQLDTLIYFSERTEIQAFNLNTFESYLIKLDTERTPLPKIEPPHFEIRKRIPKLRTMY